METQCRFLKGECESDRLQKGYYRYQAQNCVTRLVQGQLSFFQVWDLLTMWKFAPRRLMQCLCMCSQLSILTIKLSIFSELWNIFLLKFHILKILYSFPWDLFLLGTVVSHTLSPEFQCSSLWNILSHILTINVLLTSTLCFPGFQLHLL